MGQKSTIATVLSWEKHRNNKLQKPYPISDCVNGTSVEMVSETIQDPECMIRFVWAGETFRVEVIQRIVQTQSPNLCSNLLEVCCVIFLVS